MNDQTWLDTYLYWKTCMNLTEDILAVISIGITVCVWGLDKFHLKKLYVFR